MRAAQTLNGLLVAATGISLLGAGLFCEHARADQPGWEATGHRSAQQPVEDWWAAPGNSDRDAYQQRYSGRYSAPPVRFLPGYSSTPVVDQLVAQTQTEPPTPTPAPQKQPAPAAEATPARPTAGQAPQPGPPPAPSGAKPAVTPPPPTAQPPAAQSPLISEPLMTEPSPLSPFAALQAPPQPFLARLSRAPDMFGDSIVPQHVMLNFGNFTTGQPINTAQFDVPLGGGMARFKNEQARALPTDRVFAYYNHFQNALNFQTGPGGSVSNNVNLFTLGVEKTFDEGRSSVELRLPLSSTPGVNVNGVGYSANTVGNLVVTLKTLLSRGENHALAMGLATTVPTAANVDLSLGPDSQLQILNRTVHLLPYLALQLTPDDNWFFHFYSQVDVAASSNDYQFTSFGDTSSTKLRDQTLLYLDASAGYWWYRPDEPKSDGLTGVASTFELHWTSAVSNGPSGQAGILSVTSPYNRFDVLNATIGVHTEWYHHTALRVAGVLPLRRSNQNRFFDGEVQVSLIRRY